MINGSPLLNQMVITCGQQARGRTPLKCVCMYVYIYIYVLSNCDSWPNPMTSNAIWTSTQDKSSRFPTNFIHPKRLMHPSEPPPAPIMLRIWGREDSLRIWMDLGYTCFFSYPPANESIYHLQKWEKKEDILLMELMEEILRAPVDMVNIPLFTGFSCVPGGAGFLPSTVRFQES